MTLITPAIRDDLTLLYTSPTRHYHSLTHITSLLSLLSTHRAHFADPDAVEAAIWFHDAIYDPRAQGHANEIQSADLAVARLTATTDAARMEKIRKMILATATHVVPEGLDDDAAADTALFLDMDLSILGAWEEEFERYEAGVREEYAFVGEKDWRVGRGKVLRGFVERECIFGSGLFRGLLEERSRGNLGRSLARLE